jgi:putative ABC transport system permease protein
MRSVVHDVQLAARSLGRSPGLTAAAVLCLALGLGATCAVFSVIDAVLLRDLQCADPDRVVLVWGQSGDEGQLPLSMAELQGVIDSTRSLAGVAGAAPYSANLAGAAGAVDDTEPLRLTGARVTGGFFPLLGVAAQIGGTFGVGADVPGAPRVAVLSDSLWRDRFAADPTVVGRKLLLDGEPVEVLGVMPATFRFGGPSPQIWVPLLLPPTGPIHLQRSLTALGRLRPGATVTVAAAELAPATAALRRENPRRYPERWALHLDLLRERVVAPMRQPLLVLAGAVALVLLIATVNVANLLLARAAARRREVVIRTALGAGRGGLIRQVLAENLLLAVAGWGLGLLLATWSVRALIALGPEGIRRLENAHVGLATAGVGLLAALLAALVCGVPPLVQSLRPRLLGTLQDSDGSRGGGGLGRGGHRLLRGLVAVEIAFAMIVLVGAGLLARSFWSLRSLDPGFRSEGVLTAQIFLSPASYPEPRQRAFLLALNEQLADLPGAAHTGLTSSIPLLNRITMPAFLKGAEPGPGEAPPEVDWQGVSPGYFETVGIALRRGRLFGPADHGRSPDVVIVDDLLARQLWPGEDPLGRRLHLGRDDVGILRTVVGIVPHIKSQTLDGDSLGQVYTPLLQVPPRLVSAVVRAAPGADPLALLPAVRETVARLDPGLALAKIQTLDEVVDQSLAARTTVLALLLSFAAIALLLAVVGVYGVMAYSVAQRTRDLGLRMALGAGARDMLRMVLGQGLLLAGVGILAGSLGALAAGRALAALLYGIAPTDLPTFAGLAVLLLAITLLASWLPARRAARIDPATALRS